MASTFRTVLIAAQVIFTAVLAGQVAAEDAQCNPKRAQGTVFSGYRAYEENDSILKDGGDDRYTQGLRLQIAYRRDKVPCWARRVDEWLLRLWRRPPEPTPAFSLVLGQSLYTPRIITTVNVDPNDRSFSDFSFLGGQFSITSNDQTLRHTMDVDVGVLGRPGLGKGAQGGLHTLKLDRVPKGWYSTQPRAIGVNAYYRLEKRLTRKGQLWPPCLKGGEEDENCLFDLTFGHALDLGNVRTAYAWHGAMRVGWGLTGFPAATIPVTAAGAPRRKFEAGAIAAIEPRAIAYTNLVHATPESEGFSKSHFVVDQRYGLYARYDAFRLTVQRVKRSHEFSIAGIPSQSQTFASIAASYEPSFADTPSAKPWLLSNWQFELGIGANFGGPRIAVGNDHGLGSQLAARKGLIERGPWQLILGVFELAATTVETTPTPGEPGNHSDLFLQQKAVTLGLSWNPNGGKYGRAAVRGGSALWGGVAQVETIFHQPENGRTGEQKFYQDFEAPHGGWLAGGQYFLPLDRHLTVGVDVAYHSVKVDEPVPALIEPTFWKAILAVQVRP